MQYIDNSVSLGREHSKKTTSILDLSNVKLKIVLGIQNESTKNILPVDVYVWFDYL